MKLSKREVFKVLRDYSTRANALLELRRVGANFLPYYETLQLSLEQFIKVNRINGFETGISRDGKGDTKYKKIENLAPDLENFVNRLANGM